MEDNNKVVHGTSHEEIHEDTHVNTVEKPAIVNVAEDEPAPHLHSTTYLVVFAMSMIAFAQLIQLVATGAFASTVALAVGGADISGWMLTALTMAFVVFAPAVSQSADYWGRRWPLIILCVTGAVGCLITSRAQSMRVAILGEAFVGIAFAATPLTFAVVSEVLPHRHRLAGQASINAVGGFGSIFALLFGAKITELRGPEGFRILWYINVAIFALTALIVFVFYRPPPRELQLSLTTKEKLRRLDWTGYLIVLCAAVLLVMGLSWAQNPYSWRNAHVLAPLIIGGLMFLVLGLYAWKINEHSCIPHGLFSRDRNMALALLTILCEGAVFGAANVYVPFQTSVLYQTDLVHVVAVFSIALLGYIVVSPVGAYICYRYKQLQSQLVVGFICFIVFGICMATAKLDSSRNIWGFMVLLGAGLSLILNAVIGAAQLSAPPEYISIASGLMAAVRSLGVTIGVPIYGAIFHSRISALLPAKIAAAALSNGLPKSSLPALIGDLANSKTEALLKIPGINAKIIEASVLALKEAYLDSFQSVWIAVSAFSGVGLIITLCLLNPAKDLNNHIDAAAESEEALYGNK